MKHSEARSGKRQLSGQKTESFQTYMRKTGRVVKKIWNYLCQYRAVIISLPVAIGAIWLAIKNAAGLPNMVGINLLADGDFSMMVPKLVAVLAPIVVTAICIVLTICSKRTLFPWLISVFSLVLPLLIWVTNIYPA